MENGRCATEHIWGEPHLANDAAEDPPADDRVDHVHRQHHERHRQVGGGERDDEEVGRDAKGSVLENRNDDLKW